MIKLVPSAFAEPERQYLLRNTPGLPLPARRAIAEPALTRNVVVRLKVKQGQAAVFIGAARSVIEASRAAPGNLVFDIYQQSDDTDAFVIYERWKTKADHSRHLAQPYAWKFDAALKAILDGPAEVLTLRDRTAG